MSRWRDFRELTVTQLVRKFPIFYHYHIHTSPPAYHCIQSIPSHPYLQYVLQNSFNLTSDNLVLEESGPSARSFSFYQKKLHQQNRQLSYTCSKKASNSICTSTVVVSPDPLSPTPWTSSAMKTPENLNLGPWWPWASRGKSYPTGVLHWLV